MKKIDQVGAWTRSRDLFSNFGTPYISVERTKLVISNLVCGLIARPTNRKLQK